MNLAATEIISRFAICGGCAENDKSYSVQFEEVLEKRIERNNIIDALYGTPQNLRE